MRAFATLKQQGRLQKRSPGLIDAVRGNDQPNNKEESTMESVVLPVVIAGRICLAKHKVDHGIPALAVRVLTDAFA